MAQHCTLYIDDTGSRHPDRQPDRKREGRDWFALGGFLIDEEQEAVARELHREFCNQWRIRAPLHMTEMLGQHKRFLWLQRLSAADQDKFWNDYVQFLARLPVIGMACVIDRPGYVARGYLEKYKNKWLLCRSAFDITLERAVKLARLHGRKLQVVNESDPGVNLIFRGYFRNLKQNGLAFAGETSGKYNPLKQKDFEETLLTIEHKAKDHPLLQIADTFIYAIARQRYDRRFWIFSHLRDAKRISNFAVPQELIPELGIKYYCFDRAASTKKPG